MNILIIISENCNLTSAEIRQAIQKGLDENLRPEKMHGKNGDTKLLHIDWRMLGAIQTHCNNVRCSRNAFVQACIENWERKIGGEK